MSRSSAWPCRAPSAPNGPPAPSSGVAFAMSDLTGPRIVPSTKFWMSCAYVVSCCADAARDLLSADGIDIVYAVGPVPMMRAVAQLTRPFGVHTVVSLNPVMVDGTGMCGGCRVSVGGQTLFACVDGPEFDGHQVDFDEMMARQRQYLPEEKLAKDRCHSGRGTCHTI